MILLDTHALLWWVAGDRRLSAAVRGTVEDLGALVSVVSLWEVAIKRDLARIEVDIDALVDEIAATEGFAFLPVTVPHAVTFAALPKLHGDPFDRMLVAQATVEHVPLGSRDRAMRNYAIDTVW